MADGVAEADVADQDQIDVASRVRGAGCHRAKDEGALDPAGKRCESFGNHIRQAARLAQDAGEFLEDRAFAIGGVMGLIADTLARQHAGFREFGQFASERAGRRARGSGKLPQVVGLFRMQQ